jgi:hypothetical protein
MTPTNSNTNVTGNRAVDERHRITAYDHDDEYGHKRAIHRGWLKVHEGCGGIVRFVEAIDDPHVGWTGDCLHCSAASVVEEHIVFITTPAVPGDRDLGDVRDLPRDARADLEDRWPQFEDEGFVAYQEDVHAQLQEAFE